MGNRVLSHDMLPRFVAQIPHHLYYAATRENSNVGIYKTLSNAIVMHNNVVIRDFW